MEEEIQNAMDTINWETILELHVKLNLEWIFENETPNNRIPTIEELQDDFLKVMDFMDEQNIEYFEAGNWVITWERAASDAFGYFKANFVVASFESEQLDYSEEGIEELKEMLQDAIKDEDFESAAYFRDELKKLGQIV